MLSLRKIAITGSIASGKSTVCQLFKELGAFTVSADALGHSLLQPETDLGKQLIRLFGKEILKGGQFNRSLIAKKAFQDKDLLKKLEEILHPPILEEIKELYEIAQKKGTYSSFVVEIPLLFEIGAESFYDITVTVLSDEKKAKERFINSRFKEKDYDFRMDRQLAPGKKAKKSNFIIHNNGSLADLRQEVVRLNQIIQKH